MKVFISSDIEGTGGITVWGETDAAKDHAAYAVMCKRMTEEVASACTGAQAAGATHIWVKDAHGTGLNIDHTALPRGVFLNRAWSGDPLCMMDGLDETFSAAMFTGYHSPAGGDANPLSHTMSGHIDFLRINGEEASEFTIAAYAAGMLGVPVPFLAGDAGLCELAETFIPGITTVATFCGLGRSTTAPHPADTAEAIRAGVQSALSGDFRRCKVPMPNSFEAVVRYKWHHEAYKFSFFPGAQQLDSRTISFRAQDYMDMLVFFNFVLL